MEARVAAAILLVLASGLAGCVGDSGPTGQDPAEDEDGSSTPANGTYDPGWLALDDAEIRPGIGIHNRSTAAGEAWDCTSNFVFSSPDNRTLYIGLASHCVEGDQFVPLGGTVEIGEGVAYGTLVYSSWRTIDNATDTDVLKVQNDFALVEIPNASRDLVHPAVRFWGGPTGLADPPLGQGDPVVAYYNSWLHHPEQVATNHKAGVVTESDDWRTYYHTGVPGVRGDSGSPVLTAEGRALGDLTRIWTTGTQEATATNLAPALDFMEDHTNLTVELKTWPLIRDLPATERLDPAGDEGP